MSTPQKGVSVKPAHTEGRISLIYSPDGRCTPLGRSARSARSANDRSSLRLLHSDSLPTGTRSHILTSGADTFVKIFEADNIATEPRTIEHHDAAINTMAISPKVCCMLQLPPPSTQHHPLLLERTCDHHLRAG